VAAPCGTHLLAGGVSGRAYALSLPSGDVARSFRAHGSGAVSCLALSDDSSLLVSGGDDGGVAAFLILDVEAERSASADLALYRVAAHVACGAGGCNAVVVSASADGTCKVWRLADGSLLRKLVLPFTGLSLALDLTSTNLYAGGSDGRVLVASLISSPVTNASSHASDGTGKALIGVAMANGGKNLVSCSEDGEVRVWDLTHGLHLANTFWLRGAVSGVLVVKKLAREVASRGGGGDEMLKVRDDVAWTRAREVVEMEQMLRSSEEDKASSVRLLDTNIDIHKRCLRLMLREVTDVARDGRLDDGSVSD
jgi:pre-rRNA-processing protein IPI3